MPFIKIAITFDSEEFEIERESIEEFLKDDDPSLDFSKTSDAELIALLNESELDEFAASYLDPYPTATLARLVVEA
jgi:hypothetical protein